MKFSCYKDNLLKALALLIRAADPKPSLPVLSGVYLHAQDNTLELQANNLTLGIVAKFPANVETSGETVVNCARLANFAKLMPDDIINFDTKDNTLVIEAGGSKANLLTIDPADFPKVKSPDVAVSFNLAPDILHDLINRTTFAADVKNKLGRAVFTGVLVEVKDGNVNFVASNTHRFARATADIADPCDGTSFIVPVNTLNAIANAIDTEAKTPVTVNFCGRSATFEFDEFFVSTRLVEGVYPPYEKIINTSTPTHVEIETKPFTDAIKFVAPMANENTYTSVEFAISNNGVEVFAASDNFGRAVKFVPARVFGDGLNIYFNIRYISDVLNVVNSDKIKLGFGENSYSPLTLVEPDNLNFVYVCTPLRTRD